MCYEFLPMRKTLKDEIEQHKERVSMSRQVKALILEVRNALTAHKRKHPEMEAQTPSKAHERLAG